MTRDAAAQLDEYRTAVATISAQYSAAERTIAELNGLLEEKTRAVETLSLQLGEESANLQHLHSQLVASQTDLQANSQPALDPRL